MGTLQLRGGTVIDGLGGGPSRLDVRVEDALITALSDSERLPDAETFDLDGLTLLPGLIDAHTHVGLVASDYDRVAPAVLAGHIAQHCERLLDSGFTTVRDCGGVDGGLVEAIDMGLFRGPRILPAAGIICQGGGHGDHSPLYALHPAHFNCGVPGLVSPCMPCDSPDQVRAAARTAFKRGAKFLKVCVTGGVISISDSLEDTQFTVEELRAAVVEAEARHTYVTAHAHNSQGIRNGLAAGVRCFEHGTGLDEETAEAMAGAGAALVPTLAVARLLASDGPALGLPSEILARLEGIEEGMRRAIKIATAAGVPVGSGSDLVGPGQSRYGLELVLKSEVIGPMEAIRSATSVNATIIGMDNDCGSITVGKRADLIALDGDPLAKPTLFDDPRHVVLVIKGGKVVKNLLRAS